MVTINKIRYTRGDAIRLGQAVARFNRIAKGVGLEKRYEYKTLKNDIETRSELNRQIAKLRRITPENAGKWAETELNREIKLATSRLKRQLKNTPKGSFMVNNNYAMITGEIENIKKLNELPPSVKKKKIERIEELARKDYDMVVARNYRDWYLKSLDDYYTGCTGFKELKAKIRKIRNPQTFYNMIKSHENEADIYYIRYSTHTQSLFNKILEAWGLEDYGEDIEEEAVYG